MESCWEMGVSTENEGVGEFTVEGVLTELKLCSWEADRKEAKEDRGEL